MYTTTTSMDSSFNPTLIAGCGNFAASGELQPSHASPHREGLADDLRRALQEDGLHLHYQPIVCAQSGKLVSVEALVRWTHPRWGDLSPGEFIPVAEAAGLMVDLGQWVLTEACQRRRRWGEAGLVDDTFTISVNVAGEQLDRPEFVAEVQATLLAAGLAPTALRLEITETAVATAMDVIAARLDTLKALGIGLSMDDFGTGHSSLARLHQLPVDTLKVDRAFLKLLNHRADRHRFLKSVIAMAQALDLKVVVEGVESVEQHQLLRELGCLCQGFYYARPTPEPDFSGFGGFARARTLQ
ncbi:MAG: EAL domain-containing protein [Candidatus Competibacterales bacterium]